MKKLLFTTIFTLAVFTASFHAQVKHLIVPEKKINKNISLIISPDRNYTPHIYTYCEAKLDYTIVKIRGRQIDTLVQKEYPAIKLKKLSAFAEGFNQTIEIPGVSDKKERIVVSYTITYQSDEGQLKVHYNNPIPVGSKEEQLQITI